MNRSMFDALTKWFYAGISRRGVLKGLTAGALGTALTRLGGGAAGASHCRVRREHCTSKAQCCGVARCKPNGCDPGRVCCGPKGSACGSDCGCCGALKCVGGFCR